MNVAKTLDIKTSKKITDNSVILSCEKNDLEKVGEKYKNTSAYNFLSDYKKVNRRKNFDLLLNDLPRLRKPMDKNEIDYDIKIFYDVFIKLVNGEIIVLGSSKKIDVFYNFVSDCVNLKKGSKKNIHLTLTKDNDIYRNDHHQFRKFFFDGVVNKKIANITSGFNYELKDGTNKVNSVSFFKEFLEGYKSNSDFDHQYDLLVYKFIMHTELNNVISNVFDECKNNNNMSKVILKNLISSELKEINYFLIENKKLTGNIRFLRYDVVTELNKYFGKYLKRQKKAKKNDEKFNFELSVSGFQRYYKHKFKNKFIDFLILQGKLKIYGENNELTSDILTKIKMEQSVNFKFYIGITYALLTLNNKLGNEEFTDIFGNLCNKKAALKSCENNDVAKSIVNSLVNCENIAPLDNNELAKELILHASKFRNKYTHFKSIDIFSKNTDIIYNPITKEEIDSVKLKSYVDKLCEKFNLYQINAFNSYQIECFYQDEQRYQAVFNKSLNYKVDSRFLGFRKLFRNKIFDAIGFKLDSIEKQTKLYNYLKLIYELEFLNDCEKELHEYNIQYENDKAIFEQEKQLSDAKGVIKKRRGFYTEKFIEYIKVSKKYNWEYLILTLENSEESCSYNLSNEVKLNFENVNFDVLAVLFFVPKTTLNEITNSLYKYINLNEECSESLKQLYDFTNMLNKLKYYNQDQKKGVQRQLPVILKAQFIENYEDVKEYYETESRDVRLTSSVMKLTEYLELFKFLNLNNLETKKIKKKHLDKFQELDKWYTDEIKFEYATLKKNYHSNQITEKEFYRYVKLEEQVIAYNNLKNFLDTTSHLSALQIIFEMYSRAIYYSAVLERDLILMAVNFSDNTNPGKILKEIKTNNSVLFPILNDLFKSSKCELEKILSIRNSILHFSLFSENEENVIKDNKESFVTNNDDSLVNLIMMMMYYSSTKYKLVFKAYENILFKNDIICTIKACSKIDFPQNKFIKREFSVKKKRKFKEVNIDNTYQKEMVKELLRSDLRV